MHIETPPATDVDSFEHLGLRFAIHPTRATTVEVVRAADGTLIDQIHLEDPVAPAALPAVAEGWVAARVGATPPPPRTCSDCGTGLTPVLGDTDRQFDGALHLSFSGGYGMFVDPMGEPLEALLCSRCAEALAAAHPFIAELVQPHR